MSDDWQVVEEALGRPSPWPLRDGQRAALAALDRLREREAQLERERDENLGSYERALGVIERMKARVAESSQGLQLSKEGREITEAHLRARVARLEQYHSWLDSRYAVAIDAAGLAHEEEPSGT